MKDQRLYQAFERTLYVRLQTISGMNAGFFVHGISTRTESLSWKLLKLTRKPAVFDALLWFHFVKMVLDKQRANKLSCGARINYSTGNIIGFVVSKITDACNIIIRRLVHASLLETFAPYLCYDHQCGQFRFVESIGRWAW